MENFTYYIPIFNKTIFSAGVNEPFVCNRCSRSYQVKASLLRHQRYECNTVRSHQCGLCSKRFAHHFLLVRHLGSVHKVIGVPPAPKGRVTKPPDLFSVTIENFQYSLWNICSLSPVHQSREKIVAVQVLHVGLKPLFRRASKKKLYNLPKQNPWLWLI